MMVPKSWLTRADWLRPVVTVLWMPDRVTMILWGANPKRIRSPKSAAEICARECSPERYSSTLAELRKGLPDRGWQVKWIIPEELFPSIYTGTSERRRAQAVIPDWIRQCWTGLPAKAIPQAIISGFGSIRECLRNWELFCRKGSGFHFEVAGKSVFFGYTPEEIHTRVSRGATDPANGYAFSEDWIRQTKLLFSNRTGGKLHRIIIPERIHDGKTEDQGARGLVDLVIEKPPVWISSPGIRVEEALVFLHACGLTGKEQVSAGHIDLLGRKRNQELWGHRFRGACALLALAWLCSTAGACRHDAEPSAVSGDLLEWRAQQRMWETKDRQWKAHQSAYNSRVAPFQMIGSLAQSLPQEMSLYRLNIKNSGSTEENTYFLELGGRCTGEDPSATFRNWLEGVKQASSLSNIEKLHFSREGEVLEFSLHGTMKGS